MCVCVFLSFLHMEGIGESPSNVGKLIVRIITEAPGNTRSYVVRPKKKKIVKLKILKGYRKL